ncbi:hypothetical protein [Ectobacillus antri]|uniref:hypothetical protein n=1 Tax=Ectobacillus antri TaxID=2486280 RepID=UPI000F59ED8E|nr:hypothetical protein [Ectobacillus antri]
MLERVKGLLLLPNLEMATTQQVADFYEVDKKTLDTLVIRNRKELKEDGIKILKKKDYLLRNLHNVEVVHKRSHIEILDKNGNKHILTNRGSLVFPKRAILRVGNVLYSIIFKVNLKLF